ncbi:metalloregulator ArsR/SmtB family transcription factor [Pseudonocardia eucalypti]|uniref:Metalloregulator ArsR/SmtB family transcription factor n=1 Tax=Pseudonocardia eucalypti TaxID=648755 RepID=A0ABP9REC9_9PSEU|nr:DNA-binding transcriptional ArsR family regulator [Pseudonocardia eucalypti]
MTSAIELTRGDPELAGLAALFADPSRARILLALLDGRSLPASVLAGEAGVSAPTASAHLAKLREGGLITVEQSGRHRYHRLANERVATAIEALSALAPAQPIRSLRQHTKAAALRDARSCYDHLAGRLGVAVTAWLVEREALQPIDGVCDTRRRPGEPFSSVLPEHPYRLGPDAERHLATLGVDLPDVVDAPSRRPLLKFCLDWTEQRHHLGGRLGAALLTGLLDRDWLRPTRRRRALELTELGERQLRQAGLEV